ncbi:MAG: pyridoxal phosphate-dependent aminotransferase [Bacillota bacterium]
MISESMKQTIAGSSEIRKMFEEGKKLAEQYGKNNICDFSLGNPNLEPPETVKAALLHVLEEDAPTMVHGYMNNLGYDDVRKAVADSLNRRFATHFSEQNIAMTVGAAGGINTIMRVLMNPEEEVVVFAPFFGEYTNYTNNVFGKLVVVPPNPPSFLPDMEAFSACVTKKTKIVIVNTPNNPTGVVYPEETIKGIASVLEEKQKEFGTDIYLLSDEPYRELLYTEETKEMPFLTEYYDNTIIGYSWSKSLSLPGERIGYLVVPDAIVDFEETLSGIAVATRVLGFVNAPSLMQRAVSHCVYSLGDIDFYKRNRDMLYEGLQKLGYDCTEPMGAFYLWVKTPMADETKFVEMARNHQILVVPGRAFGCSGYVRMAYCVAPETIERALPRFEKLMTELKSL